MIVAIVGSRFGLDWNRVNREVRELVRRPDVTLVVSGGATGVDRIGESFALAAGKKTHIFRPDWSKYGRGAGFRRNVQIAEMADEIHAWWNGESRGTAHTIDVARKMRKRVIVHRLDGTVEDSASSTT